MTLSKEGKAYLLTYAALQSLLVLTVVLSYFPLGVWALVSALAISAAKSLLVIFYFMELRHDRPVIYLAAAVGFVWLIILYFFVFVDLWGRPAFN